MHRTVARPPRHGSRVPSDEARLWIAEKGYDPDYGARPLKRVIERQVKDPLSAKLLAGRFAGPVEVKVGVKDDELTFDVKQREVPPASGN